MSVEFINPEKLNKTIALSSGEQIKSIMSALNSILGITHYCYIRSFPDGSHLLLSNDSSWIESFYLDFYDHGVFHKIPDSYQSGHVLWSTLSDQTTFAACRENFNIAHGITLIEKQKEYCEFFCFGTTVDNIKIMDFYIYNLDLLKRFNAFFKERADKLIREANADRIILPRCSITTSEEVISSVPEGDFSQIRKNLIAATQCKRYYLSGPFANVFLSPRQLACLNLLTLGKSLKEIARVLNISPRTVETYLNIIKCKLGIQDRANLIINSLRYNQYIIRTEDDFFWLKG
ncbi:MAG TPA: LuxR C-terminal-related transcriptional regulator [Gammaproteobacteria bacterium]|nr:LuxR C-terminal-related transcriptional regulator [Gammaproteobacteria bacterium]